MLVPLTYVSWQSVLQAVGQSEGCSPYQVLGVAEDDLEMAKQAMKQLCLRLHPDKAGIDIASEAYSAVAQAWEQLKPKFEEQEMQQVFSETLSSLPVGEKIAPLRSSFMR